MGFGFNIGLDLNQLLPSSQSSTSTSGQTTQKVLTQAGIDKLIYDVLSSDSGLSALAQGENVSGGYGSSSKSLMTQDLVTKLVGELANVTAPTVTSKRKVLQ
jgi:hypothetical protein